MITWLASYPKSGNTWLRLFLATYLTGQTDINAVQGVSHDDLTPYFWQVVSPVPLDQLSQDSAFACRGAVLVHTLAAKRWAHTYLKTHSACGRVNGNPLLPQSLTDRAVYIVRDPRDVAVSYAHHTQTPIDDIIDTMESPHCLAKAPGLYNALGPWSEHVRGYLAADTFPVHIMRYEDMHTAPKDTFGAAVEFLGLERDSDKVREAIEATWFPFLQEQEQAYGFREASDKGVPFFRNGQAGAWRDELTDAQVKHIEAFHGETMERMGYELG